MSHNSHKCGTLTLAPVPIVRSNAAALKLSFTDTDTLAFGSTGIVVQTGVDH